MTTSGSNDFSVNRNEICNAALRKNRIISISETPSADHIAYAAEALNLIVKQWKSDSDFAPGLKEWSRKRGFLFPAYNDAIYSIGPNGDNATASYTSTTISSNEALGQTVLSVTSTTGMTAADYIGITLNNGTIQWTTIVSIGAGPTVTITTALIAAADAGKTVYWYTTKLDMPIKMLSVRRLNTSNNEMPLSKMSFDEYEEGISNKTSLGTPTRYLYEPGIAYGEIRFDYRPSDVSDIFLLTFLREIQDFDAATDTPDYPVVWYRPLVYQLAIDIAPEYKKPVTQELKLLRDESLMIAQNANPDNSVMYFEPERF